MHLNEYLIQQYMSKTILLGKNQQEIIDIALENGFKPFVGKQLCDWIYKKRVGSFDEMTNISVANREKLKEKYEIGYYEPSHVAESIDGTHKYLFTTEFGDIETVFIPEEDRATLCISSQVGCKMNCLFCMTGKQGWSGNLSATDILNQFFSIPETEKLTNIVFMGMGEPLDNLPNVLKTIEVLTADWGHGWSPHRITLSTIGLLPKIKIFLEKTECHLAISMHNPFPKERLEMMPAEKAYSITKIIEELKSYDFAHQRRLSFEYIMFAGKNDTPRHAAEMVRLLKGMPCRVNLIRFHEIPVADLHTSDDDKMFWFRDYLTSNGVMCTIRRSRGQDIDAACGLLSSNHKKQ